MTQDYGYSNYTVEGTDHHCLKTNNPYIDGAQFDNINSASNSYYIKDGKSLFEKMCEFAEHCDYFSNDVQGIALRLDVEGEVKVEWCGDAEVIEAYNNYKF